MPDDRIGVVWDVQWQFERYKIALISPVGHAREKSQGFDRIQHENL